MTIESTYLEVPAPMPRGMPTAEKQREALYRSLGGDWDDDRRHAHHVEAIRQLRLAREDGRSHVVDRARAQFARATQIDTRAGRRSTRPSRNQPCDCGSGRKTKHCCGSDL